MRIDCKFYESRTYASGDTVRMCRLDLAPEAPWRCPVDCPKYQRKTYDGGWVHGSLVPPPVTAPSADEEAIPENIAGLLDAAEDIVNMVGPGILAEVERDRQREQARRRKPRRSWWPFGRK